jgi:hypothetical protein
MAVEPEIAIVTSIPPRVTREQAGRNIGAQYQLDCVASWVAAGFKILSVNLPAEIELLAPRFPEIEFVPAERDAGAIAGRPTPMIEDLLLALERQPQSIVGIVNADVCMETGKSWMAAIRDEIDSTILIGHRLDLDSWSTQVGEMVAAGVPYTGGFDLFFFEKSAIRKCIGSAGGDRPFSIGMPWWDFWLPAALALQGHRVARLEAPVAGHLVHPIKYDPAAWEYMGAQLVEYVYEQARAAAFIAPELRQMVGRAEELAPRATKEIRHWTRDRALTDRGDKWSSRYKTNLELFCGQTLMTLRDGVGFGEAPRRIAGAAE